MKRLIVICAFFMLPALSSYAGSIDFNGIAGAGNYNIPVKSFVERRFKTIYKQQYDFSCGSATLASLLTYHYDDIVDEQSVFNDMYKNGNQQLIQKKGFSLLDMKFYLERRGYQADGYKINLDQLIAAKAPAITIINNKGYLHFVIIKGLNEQDVLVGDPAVGLKTIPRDEFEEMWGKRILFLIRNKQSEDAHFQDQEEWALRSKAPLGTAVDRSSLSEFNLLQPGRWDF
ncbi:C39 family peptidase [Methylobacter sp.]|uniref:C39 family peptidase n=1 Tax=Methylobacter sp. TaxID=2051955 RepID=UPI003DA3C44B